MIKINHFEYRNILEESYGTNVPLMVHGTMGIGKSRAMKEFARAKAEELGLPFSCDPKDVNNEKVFLYLEFIAHLMDVGEMKGIIFPSEDRKRAEILPLGVFPSKGQGILFFDEVNLASPSVMNNLYQVFLNRRIGTTTIPKEYKIFAAGNTDSDAANIYDMPAPLRDRMLHVELTCPSVKEWVENYARPRGIDPRVVNYLLYKRDYLHTWDEDKDQMVFATPRSWEVVSCLLGGKKTSDITNRRTGLIQIASAVGEGIATDMIAFLKLTENTDLDKIIREGRVKNLPDDLGELYSLSASISMYFKEKTSEEEPSRELLGKIGSIIIDFLPRKEIAFNLLSMIQGSHKGFLDSLDKYYPELFERLADELLAIAL